MEVDNQILSDYRYCPTRGRYRHLLGLVPKAQTSSLLFGSGIHKGMEEYEKSGRNVEKAVLAFGAFYAPYDGTDKIRTMEKGEELIRAYHNQFGLDGWKCLKAEVKFKIEIHKDVIYVGKLDQIGVMPEFGMGIKDIKTSKQPWNFVLTPNDQFTGYFLGGQTIMGKECANFWLDMFGIYATSKDGKRKLKDGGMESVLQRSHMQRTEEQLDTFVKNVVMWCKHVQTWQDMEFWPMNTDNCNGKYGPCAYLSICKSPGSVRESIIEGFYVKDIWTPGGPDAEVE